LNNDSVQTLSELTSKDADAFIESVELVVKTLRRDDNVGQPKLEALAELACSILASNEQEDSLWNSKTHGAAQKLLLTVMESASPSMEELLRKIRSLSAVQTGCSPLSQDTALMLSGALLSTADITNEEVQSDLSSFVKTLRSAVTDDNPFDTRLAAAQAMSWFVRGQNSNLTLTSSDVMLDLHLVVYDQVNDDDDDIRDIAAHTVSFLLDNSSAQTDMIPPFAGSCLSSTLVRRYKDSTHLARRAADRLRVGSLTVSDILLGETKDSALFAEEKQNLFIDPAREAKTWSMILSNLSPHAFDDSTIKDLSDWTVSGLDALTTRISGGLDGPLGWTREPDIFVLGLRIIYASEVLIHLARQTRRAIVSASTIRAKLVTLLTAGRKSEVNMLWIGEIEKVINKSLDTGFTKLSVALRHVELGAMSK